MATHEQIEEITRIFFHFRPAPFFKQVNDANAGIGAVMGFLYRSGGDVTAGSIAEAMDVSTARVAVLLKKMAAKGLIVKQSSPTDARVTIVHLTDQGQELAASIKAHLFRQVGDVIDQIGMDRLREFFAVAQEISRITPIPKCDLDACLMDGHCRERAHQEKE